MARLHYLDFELKIQRNNDHYIAKVLESPTGEAENSFLIPFSEDRLENLILKAAWTRRSGRRIHSVEMDAARELGGKLFDAVISGELRACLRGSMEAASACDDTGLRIKLRLQEAPELADLPWEFLFDTSLHRFLAHSIQTPIVRYIEMPERIRPLAIGLPLRVLVMIVGPLNYACLDVEREKNLIVQALHPLVDDGKVVITCLENPTLSDIQRRLRSEQFNVFHFIGHSGYSKEMEEGVLILRDERGDGWQASGRLIGTLLHDHRTLRLAILNSCEGARNSRTDPFASVATTLILQGIPAVVAMQFEISDEAAITFSSQFYAALVDGYPVDAAVAEARKAIYIMPNDVEWGTPVLYLRSPDGKLFDVETKGGQFVPETGAAAPPAIPTAGSLPPLEERPVEAGKGRNAAEVEPRQAKEMTYQEEQQRKAADAKRQAEEEARQRAEAEAARQREEEREKAEKERKVRAEEESRYRAEQEKRKEEQREAAAEAERQAEEARQRAEAEAARQPTKRRSHLEEETSPGPNRGKRLILMLTVIVIGAVIGYNVVYKHLSGLWHKEIPPPAETTSPQTGKTQPQTKTTLPPTETTPSQTVTVQPPIEPTPKPTPRGRNAISRQEVEEFVDSYLRATEQRNTNDIMSLYADRVDYFSWGKVEKQDIRGDKASFFKRYPESRAVYSHDLVLNEIPGSGGRVKARFTYSFDVRNTEKAVKGVAENTWILGKSGGSLKIFDEKQRILNHETTSN